MDRAKVLLHISTLHTNRVLNRVPIANDQHIFNYGYGIGKATEHALLVGPMSSSSTSYTYFMFNKSIHTFFTMFNLDGKCSCSTHVEFIKEPKD